MQTITFHLVTEHGPGGGNPVVRFRGPHNKMTRLVSGEAAGRDADLGQARLS